MTALQNSITAVAYAEEGKFETQRGILKAEDGRKKRVLLGINDLEIKPKLISYAHQLSERVGGQLEVLQFLTPSMVENTFEFMHNPRVQTMRDKGIAYKILTGLGTIEEDLLSYAQDKRNIMLVLLKNSCDENKSINVMQIMGKLNCPVVVFSEII